MGLIDLHINFVNPVVPVLIPIIDKIINFITPVIASFIGVAGTYWFIFRPQIKIQQTNFLKQQAEERKRWVNDIYAKKEADLWLKFYPLITAINNELALHFKTPKSADFPSLMTITENKSDGLINTLHNKGVTLIFDSIMTYSEFKPYYEARLEIDKFNKNSKLLMTLYDIYSEITNLLLNDELKFSDEDRTFMSNYTIEIAEIKETVNKKYINSDRFKFYLPDYDMQDFENTIKALKADTEIFKNETSSVIAGHLSKS